MESTTIGDTTPTTVTENGNGTVKNGHGNTNGVNGHTNHIRKHSSSSGKDYEQLNKDSYSRCAPEKRTSIGAYDKLRGLFRSKGSSAGSKSPPRIKVSMYPDGAGDKSMAQKGSSHPTKLTLEARDTQEESDTDFEIPNDGNLYGFSPESMVQFFKYMHFDDKIVKSLQRRKLDGRKFAKMTDEDLKKNGIDNPIVVYFRSRSEKKRESKNLFML